MDSHLDREHSGAGERLRRLVNPDADRWMKSLEAKAAQIRQEERSKITGGAEGEPVLAEWESNGVYVKQRPDDEHGILRISIGGGDELPVAINYLVFRGDHGRCVDLLRKALAAIEDRRS